MHSASLYYSQEEIPPLVEVPCFGASGFKSMTSSQLYFPGKTLAACLDPLAFAMSQAYNSLIALDGDAEELID